MQAVTKHMDKREEIKMELQEKQIQIAYKIYMEAEDIGQSRIHACTAFLKNRLEQAANVYIKGAEFDDESDPDAFILRFYAEHSVREDVCGSPEDAESFVIDLAQILDDAACAHSFMELEGSFSWKYGDEAKTYTFRSESGCDYCDFKDTFGKGQS